MKVLYLVAVTLALVAAAPKSNKLIKTKSNPRIINGQEAAPHSIPYSAFLKVSSEETSWSCGGTLISENYVLTAGHCGLAAVQAEVTLGAHNLKEDEDSKIILISTDITVHEGYADNTKANDIAVIKLPEAVSLSDDIQLISLPSRADSENSYQGVTARISGWGVTDFMYPILSDVLYYVDVTVISNEACARTWAIYASNICTSGSDESGSCSGDSGGPLVYEGTQIGIVTFSMMFCLPGYPSGFVRVTSFLDWIEENTDVVIN